MQEKKEYLSVKDFSVSKESFQLLLNEKYQMLETFPQPKIEQLPEYYKSEDYISHTSSKRNLFEKAYHVVRKLALKKKVDLINGFKPEEKTLLDIGCGTGDFLATAQEQGWNITGIEPNDQARALANKNTSNKVFDNPEISKLKNERYDVITLWHVLEHLPDLEHHISEFKRLLKPNGYLVIAVPNFKSFDANHYKEFWAAYDVPRHLWHFSPKAIKLVFEEVNMTVVNKKPMWFDSFYVSLLSEKYKTGSMNPAKGFYIGLVSNLKAIRSKQYSSVIYIIKNKENT